MGENVVSSGFRQSRSPWDSSSSFQARDWRERSRADERLQSQWAEWALVG